MGLNRLIGRYSRRNGIQTPLALVTGGTSGMGLEYARQLAAQGCDLVLVSNQQEALVEQCSALAEEFSVNVHIHYSDLSRPEAAGELLQWCVTEGLEIDFLILNAGMFFFKEMNAELLKGKTEAMLQLHVMTNTRLACLFGERMKARGCGHILLVSSMAARLPMPGISIYAATKAYLRSFGKSMHIELRPYGVGLTVLCPAAIATPLYNLKPSLMRFGVAIRVIKTPQWLVKRALKGMLRFRRCMSPAGMNLWLPALVNALPNRLVRRIWCKIK